MFPILKKYISSEFKNSRYCPDDLKAEGRIGNNNNNNNTNNKKKKKKRKILANNNNKS